MADVSSTASAGLRSLAQSLMARDRQPLERMQSQKTELQSRQTLFRTLGSSLSALQSLARSFSSISSANPLRALTAEGMNTDALEVTVDSRAVPGNHTIEVLRLATTHSLASQPVSADGANAVTGGTGPARFSFTVGEETYEVSAEIGVEADQQEALGLLARAINNTDAPVRALVMNVGGGERRLILQAKEGGSEGRITEVKDLEGTWMHRLGLSTAARLSQGAKSEGSARGASVQEGTDALLLVDGVEVASPTNTITDLFPGVSLTLKAAGTGPQEVRIKADVDAVVEQVQEFLEEYNSVTAEVRKQTRAADESGENRGLLTGDILFTRLRSVMRSAITNPVEGRTYGYLSEIGVTSDRDGRLTISDQDALRAAIEAEAEGVQDLFRGDEGVAGRLYSVVREYSGLTGILGRRNETLRRRISSLDGRIAQTNESLVRREQALIKELADMEATLRLLSQQQSYLGSLLSSGDSIYTQS